MLPRDRATDLARLLTSFGLDLNRYTPALAEAFLKEWPNSADWNSARAQAELVATFAIGETTFLRHPEHFATLRRLIPELRASNNGESTLRAFSAGCASGEEAYSLAATLSSEGALQEVIAWDLNPEAIARAKEGSYRPWSLRGVEAGGTTGWLEPHPCGVRVTDHTRRAVRFEVGNLCSATYPADLDIIFCRNVLLYFRPELANHVIERLAQALRPGGVLFLGHYDPRPTLGSPLVPEAIDGVTFYRRPTKDASLSNVRPIVAATSSQAPPPLTCLTANGRRRRAQRIDHVREQMQQIRLKANQRRTTEALTLLDKLVHDYPTRPDLHVLTALVAEEAGDPSLMLTAARKACFLVPDHAAPNYFLSVAFLRTGELHRASLHRRVARDALQHTKEASHVLDYSEGLTVGQLRRLLSAVRR